MGMPLRESVLQARRLPRNDHLLMARATLLSRDDRELIEAVFIRGQTTRSLSHMIGVEMRPLRDRVRRLAKRLASRKFVDVARSLPYLSSPDAQLARLRFCEGRKLCELRGRFNVTDHTLRRWLDHVSAQVAVIRRMSKQSAEGAGEDYRSYWRQPGQDT